MDLHLHTKAKQKTDRQSAIVTRASFHDEGYSSSSFTSASGMMPASAGPSVDCVAGSFNFSSWSFSLTGLDGVSTFCFSRSEDSADDPSAATAIVTISQGRRKSVFLSLGGEYKNFTQAIILPATVRNSCYRVLGFGEPSFILSCWSFINGKIQLPGEIFIPKCR